MSNPLYIGISGPARGGKDTLGNLIKEELVARGFDVARIALADELKSQCASTLGLDVDLFYNDPTKEPLRPFMQWYGDYKKNPLFGGYEMYWCDQVGIKQFENHEDVAVVIVPDIRYDFEADWVREMQGGVVVKLDADNYKPTVHAHHSENGISDACANYFLRNNHAEGGLATLKKNAQAIVGHLENKI